MTGRSKTTRWSRLVAEFVSSKIFACPPCRWIFVVLHSQGNCLTKSNRKTPRIGSKKIGRQQGFCLLEKKICNPNYTRVKSQIWRKFQSVIVYLRNHLILWTETKTPSSGQLTFEQSCDFKVFELAEVGTILRPFK